MSDSPAMLKFMERARRLNVPEAPAAFDAQAHWDARMQNTYSALSAQRFMDTGLAQSAPMPDLNEVARIIGRGFGP
jgi:hypothetical protein